MKTFKNSSLIVLLPAFIISALLFQSCSTFNYKTYEEQKNVDDPEPNYDLTLDPGFQEYTSYMFIGNRVENFGTYFNTFFNASENYEDAYEDYETKVLSTYSERLDSIFATPNLNQEAKDKFTKAIEKASKVIQYHKSSAFMDRAVLLIGKCYFYLGDYLKAERKFGEFVSKLSKSPLLDEVLLYLARTQMRLGSNEPALVTLNNLIERSKDKQIIAGAYQSLGEYYINKKDYDASLANYKKSIELSNDSKFRAQMQFLIASVTARQDPGKAAGEFLKVLDYSTSFELEYLARYNYVKNLILSNNFGKVLKLIKELRVDYKESPEYLSDIEFLEAKYYDQKKEYKSAIKKYKEVIISYPKTIASSDASFAIGSYYENIEGNYLTAYKYYRFSNDENLNGHNSKIAAKKMAIYKKYFDLCSVIADKVINTDYDSTFLRGVKPAELEKGKETEGQNKIKGKGDEGPGGKPGGYIYEFYSDSLNTGISSDSIKLKEEKIIKAKFELAELFIYDMAKPDSAEKYLKEAYEESEDYDFKSKVLFALAVLYKNNNRSDKYEDILRNIVNEYPLSPVANECRKLLNLPLAEEKVSSPADSIFSYSENKFASMEYGDALAGFLEITSNYPSSEYFTRSNYAAGWIYENILLKPDSAYIYYTNVVVSAPMSEYYNAVAEKLTNYENSLKPKFDSLSTNDSLKTADTNKTVPPEEMKKQLEEKKQEIDNTNGEGEKKDLPNKNLEMKKEDDNTSGEPTKK